MTRTKDKSKKAFLEAIDRIKCKACTSKKLRGKSEVKLNKHNVEIEAGFTTGSLRHHPDIVAIIVSSGDPQVDIDSLKEKIEELKADKKKLERDSIKQKRKMDLADNALSKQLSLHHQTITALFFKLPLDERESLISKLDERQLNVSGSITNINSYRCEKD
jgi:hypothetical protein